jgi:hypothetical protein
MSNEASQVNPVGNSPATSDLVVALLQSEDVILHWQPAASNELAVEIKENPHSRITHPWDPTDPAAAPFFNHLDETLDWSDWEKSEIERKSQAFYQHLDQLWAVSPLQTALAKKFVTVPQNLLSAIARQAQQLANTSHALADQLLYCVSDVLPQWAPEDLQVLARPLAYAMRGDEASDTALDQAQTQDWNHLSEIEQARLSLVIARYALGKVQASE